MGANKAQHQLGDRLLNQIQQNSRDLRELKGKQRIGGDNTVVDATNTVSVVYTVPAGSVVWKFISVTPADGRLALWDFLFSLYVDNPSPQTPIDANYIWTALSFPDTSGEVTMVASRGRTDACSVSA